MPIIQNENQFLIIRNQLLNIPTHRQSQVALRAAQANIDQHQADETHNAPKITTEKNDKPTTNYENKLIIHYTHEKRFRSTKRDLHQIYDNIFKNTPVEDVKIIVGNKNQAQSKRQLIRKRPNKSILTNKPNKSKSILATSKPKFIIYILTAGIFSL